MHTLLCYIELLTTHTCTIMVYHLIICLTPPSFSSSSDPSLSPLPPLPPLPPLLLFPSLLYQGFLDQSLMCVAFQRLDKQVLGCSEQLMQAQLEQMDGNVRSTCMSNGMFKCVCVCAVCVCCVCVCVRVCVCVCTDILFSTCYSSLSYM